MDLNRFISNLERSKISLLGFVLSFFAIVFIRNVLENLFELPHAIEPFSIFLHYTIFYIALFLGFVLLLKLLSGQRIENVSKVVLFFWGLMLLYPLFDWFLSFGQSFKLTYLIAGIDEIASNFFTYGYYTDSFSLGQKVVVFVALLLSATYVWKKTSNALKTVIAFFSSYLLIAFYCTLPSWILFLTYSLHGPFPMDIVSIAISHTQIILLVLVAIQLLLWLFFFDRKKAFCLLKNLQLLRLSHYLLMAFFGLLVFQNVFNQPPTLLSFFTFLLSGFFAFQASVVFNDLADHSIDKKSNKKTPLTQKVFSQKELLYLAFFESLLSLLFALTVSFAVFSIIFAMLLFSWIYSMPPLRLRRLPFISIFVLALISLLVVFAGFYASGANSIALFPFNFSLLILIFVFLGFNAKDLKDFNAEKELGIKSLPVLFGLNKSRKIISLFIAIAYLSAFVLTGVLLLLPFALFFAVLSHFLLTKAKTGEIPILLAYFAFFLLFIWLVFL